MWFLLRQFRRYARFVIWGAALTSGGAVYTLLSTREVIAPFGGEPHVIEWWEPYVWPLVTIVVVSRGLRMVLNLVTAAANAHLARLRRGDVFGPKKD